MLKAQNPGLMADDSGEMIAAAVGLGIPHPPGYPLFILLGRLASLVPLGSPAFRLNCLSSAWVLIGLWVLAMTMLRSVKEGVDRKASTWIPVIVSTTLLGVFSAHNVFAQGLTAKGGVYTLTFLILTSLLFLFASDPAGKNPRMPIRYLAWFLGSLGMAHHWPTTLLWIPFYLFWQWRGQAPVRRAAIAFSFIVIGLSLYLVLPLRAALHPTLDWGHPSRWYDFYWVVTRKLSEGTEPWLRAPIHYFHHAREVFRVLGIDTWPGQAAFALAGAFLLWKSDRRCGWAWALLVLPMIAAIIVVPRSETTYLLNVYLVAVQAVVAVAAFTGLTGLYNAMGAKRDRLRKALFLVLLLLPAGWTLRTLKTEDKSRYFLQEDYGTNLLKALPRGSFLIGEGDVNLFPLYYRRIAQQQRVDIGMIPLVFLQHHWGWEQVVRQRPLFDSVHPVNFEECLGTLHSRYEAWQGVFPFPKGQDLFYTLDTFYLDALSPGLRPFLVPMGLVYGVTSRFADLKVLARWVDAAEASQRRRGGPPGTLLDPKDPMSRDILWRYGDSQWRVADRFFRAGDPMSALRHFDRSVELCPTHPRAYSNMVMILGQAGWWELAKRVASKGIAAAEPSPVLYQNMGNACLMLGEYDAAFRAYAQALRLKPGWKEARDQLEASLRMKETQFDPGPSLLSAEARRVMAGEFRLRGCRFLSALVEQAEGKERP